MSLATSGDNLSNEEQLGSHLISSYPPAITDFYGSGSPCIYKTGPAWPVAKDPRSQKIIRAARPIHNHRIMPVWRSIVWDIVALLDSRRVDWSTIDPLAYANAGEAALICDFVITIGVKPHSLSYQAAVAAANAIDEILQAAGFPEIQVAFIESVYRLLRKLMGPLSPTFDLEGIQGLRKPFTPTLGLSIAPRSSDNRGTGGLFFRLNTDKSDNSIVLLTCAHVARPPGTSLENRAYTRENESQPREDIILLGDKSFTSATEGIVKFEMDYTKAISSWERSLSKVPPQEEGEADEVSSNLKRQHWTHLISDTKKMIAATKDLHSYVTKNLTQAPSRILGSVLHSAKIEAGDDDFLYDWAFIQIDDDKLDSKDFQGNKLFVGGNKTPVDWENFMFPQPHDHRDFHVPDDSLLQLKDYVSEAEFHNPQNYDIHDAKTLLAVKNGPTTGTTFGRVNGLESATRHYLEDGVAVTALEFIVCAYDTKTAKNDRFSDGGDSGAIVAGRDGRIIGQVVGGAGFTEGTDKTYITPYYALKKAIERKYPNADLLPAAT
ncbi:hypothetical protein CC1G_02806 [Coprinopsis cinerea okayama7|uniref:Uncharacterized protein n=1 Tax=Coprinopsis cinerea (strain Okayama-7 / 130 / ATCC MYA-4618 / FGSC 9003) TaxID=240176 RepID=A8N037_COPC7|nr:hypothetical protein CC1G_02806 [Coprinopsis cinerea okayama7\|eukprot:XP_001828225.1 hypothetical protein CC1G_02806 [Coprinopsis cinerea okayama7\